MDARERLDRAIMELSAAHAELDSVALESKLVPHPERAKVGDLAGDVMEAARLLRLVQDEASNMSWQATQVASQMTRPPDWVHEPGISCEEFFARSRQWYASQNLEELAAEMVRSTEATEAGSAVGRASACGLQTRLFRRSCLPGWTLSSGSLAVRPERRAIYLDDQGADDR